MVKTTELSLDRSGGLEHRRLHLREISADGDAPLETVGLDLRAARLRKGEELAVVSGILKIRKDYLEGLEESNLAALPGRAYAIGFLRSYAEHLGLDAAVCIDRFKTEIAGRDHDAQASAAAGQTQDKQLPRGAMVLVALLVVAVIYAVYYQSSSSNQAVPEVIAVPERLAAEAEVVAAPPSIAPAPPPEAAPAPPPEVAPPPAPAAAPTPPTAAELAASLPPGRTYGIQNANSRVVLRVHEQTRVLVRGREEMIFINRVLNPGDVYRVPNIVGLLLTTADMSAVEVLVEGTSIGFLGAKGSSAEGLSLNPRDLMDRVQQRPG